MYMCEYTDGANWAISDCQKGNSPNLRAMCADTPMGKGYHAQWEHMIMLRNAEYYPGARALWSESGRALPNK